MSECDRSAGLGVDGGAIVALTAGLQRAEMIWLSVGVLPAIAMAGASAVPFRFFGWSFEVLIRQTG